MLSRLIDFLLEKLFLKRKKIIDSRPVYEDNNYQSVVVVYIGINVL